MWSTPLSPTPSLYHRDKHSKAIKPSMKSPSGCSMGACWNPCSSWGTLDGALCAAKSQMPSLENICLPLCLLVATLASSSCRTHWTPIYILVHSNAALLASPTYFLINSGMLSDACSLPKGRHCKYKAIQLNKLGKPTVSTWVSVKSPVLDLQQSKHHINQRNT